MPTALSTPKEPMRSCAPSSMCRSSAAGGKLGSGFLSLRRIPSPFRMMWATKPPGFANEMRRFCTVGAAPRGARRDRVIERVVGRLDVLRHVDVGHVERFRVLVESVRHAVGGKPGLQRDPPHLEEMALQARS